MNTLFFIRIFNLLILFFMICFINSCSLTDQKNLSKIKIAGYYTDSSFLLHIASINQYFVKNGLQVEIIKHQTGRQGMEAVLKGEADIAIIFDYAFTLFSLDEKDLKILTSISESNATELLVRKDRGIQTQKDLIGKKIGVTLNTVAEYTLHQFLINHKIPSDQTQIVHTMPNDFIKAFTDGSIDALISWEPFNYKIKASFNKNIDSWRANPNQDLYLMLVSKSDWIAKNPNLAQKLIQSLLEAEEFVDNNQEKSKQILSEFVQLDLNYVYHLWSKLRFRVSLQQALLSALEDQTKWIIEKMPQNKHKVFPNYLNTISFETLNKLRPDKVTIFH